MKDYSNYYPKFSDMMLSSGRTIFEQQLLGSEGKDILINGTPTRALVQYHTNPMNDEKEDRRLTVWNDVDIKRGDIVRTVEDGDDYIVITRVKHNDMIKYTKILYCNNVLTWQDEDTLEIKTVPCVLTDKTSVYSSGISEGKYLTLADDQILVVVPETAETKQIYKGKRYIFNNSKKAIYKTSKVDGLTEEGMINVVMKHDTHRSESDRVDLNIADYIEDIDIDEPVPPDVESITIVLTGDDKVGAMTEGNYVATVYEGGNIVDKDVVFTLNDKLASFVSTSGNECTLIGNEDFRTGDTILRATLVEDETVFAEKSVYVAGF